jgi:hypothetical protein
MVTELTSETSVFDTTLTLIIIRDDYITFMSCGCFKTYIVKSLWEGKIHLNTVLMRTLWPILSVIMYVCRL